MVPYRDLQNIEPGPEDLCPCDSGKPSKLCCRTTIGWMKEPSRIEIERGGPPLPKCYAHTLGSCGTVITREHAVSESVLKVIGEEITAKGLGWLADGETKDLRAEVLASNILCDIHNHALSPIDKQGARFVQTMAQLKEEIAWGVRQTVFKIFSGEDIERWLLKVLLGGCASKQFAVLDGKAVTLHHDLLDVARLVDLLFGRTPFAPPVGLYSLSPHQRQISTHPGRGILMAVITSEVGVVGLQATLMHCLIGFMTQNVGFPNAEYESVMYRPRFIRFHEEDGGVRHIELTWKSGGSHQGINIAASPPPQAMKS
jgi:hypothetical protein